MKALIADISHQTRTPISNLLLYASLLGEGELSPQQREQVQALTAQGEKLSFLIQALVKASRWRRASWPRSGPQPRGAAPGGGRRSSWLRRPRRNISP